jgi:hypothetical protein
MIVSNTLLHAIQRLLVAGLLILAWAPELPAQATAFPVVGVVTDADQVPVVGYRVVLRATGSEAVYLSGPTDEEGAYRVDVPTGVNLRPVAVISPLGGRVAIDGMVPQAVLPGVRIDIELVIRLSAVTEPRPFPGADRLFRSFVEDVVFVERLRVQTQVAGADFDGATSYLTELLGAYNFTALPRLEVGGRVGYAGTEFDSTGTGVTGMTDLDLWGKLLVHTSPSSGLRSSAGALLTLPTGEADTGRATGAFGAKLFGALRYDVWRLTLAANGGLRFSGDSEFDGVDRTGQVSGSLAAAAFLPLGTRLVAVGELGFESARYEDGLDEGIALLGVNWKVLREGILRLAFGFGLADGSPDVEFVAGYAFEF